MAAALVLTLGACDWMVVDAISADRAAAGRSTLASSETLVAGARARAQLQCDTRTTAASPDPASEFDAETAAAVGDLAGSAPLDPTIADGTERNKAATREVLAGWAGNPVVTDARWNDLGVADVVCPDGRLYVSAVFSQRPTVPTSGRYLSAQYTAAQVQKVAGIRYGTAANYAGVPTALVMDLWAPPSAGVPDRPVIMLFHGGGFVGGSRNDWGTAPAQLAAMGYVVVAVDYRLRPAGATSDLVAAADGIDDGMEAVRWLEANATTYRIDTTRIGALGTSAGGVISLGLALADDLSPGGPLAAQSPTIHGAVSTGGHLTPGLSLLNLAAADPAVLMFNYEIDNTAGPAEYAFETCAAVRSSGNTCDFVEVPGEGHQSWITPGSPFWTSEVSPFLWQHLRLASA